MLGITSANVNPDLYRHMASLGHTELNLEWKNHNFKCCRFFSALSFSVLTMFSLLTHWGWVTHICVSKLTIIGSDNGLSPGRRQAIIWTNGGILLIGPLKTNFSEIFIEIHKFSFTKMHLKMSSGKWRPFCPGLNVLKQTTPLNPWMLYYLCVETSAC